MIIESQAKNAELLPNYETATKGSRQPPPVPVIYSFTNWQHGSMLLMPPRDAPSQQPLYRITVDLDLNPFLPVSYSTRITRCGRQEGEVVGEFAFALNNKRAVLRMGDLTTRLSNALYSVNSSPRHFNWILENRLHWDCRSSLPDGSPLCIGTMESASHTVLIAFYAEPSPFSLTFLPQCYLPSPQTSPDPRAPASASSGQSVQIATFVPPPHDASPPLPDATLTVFPSGFEIMDEIVISALVVERMLTR